MASPVEIALPLGLLSVMAIVANSIVLYLVFKNRHMRTATNGFVVSLAISDILTGLVIFFQYLVGFRNAVVINVVYAIVLICGAANLTAVTLDRYLAITMPFVYPGLMANYSKAIISLTWVISVFIALLPLCWHGNVSASYHKIYILLVVFVCIILPFLFILFANIKIFQIVKNCIQKEKNTLIGISNNVDGDTSIAQPKHSTTIARHIISSEAKIAKVFVVATIAFAVAWFPVLYYTLAAGFGHYHAVPHILIQASPFVIVLGSLANPVIYSFMKPDFRLAVSKIITCHGNRCQTNLTVIYKRSKTQAVTSPSSLHVSVVGYNTTSCSTRVPMSSIVAIDTPTAV